MAKAIGEPKSTVHQVIAGKYPKGKTDGFRKHDEIWRDLDKYLALQAERKDVAQPEGFAWTSVADEIRGVVKATVLLNLIGVVYGLAGIGKTLTLQALRADYPGSILITIDEGCTTPTTFLRTVCKRLKLSNAGIRHTMMEAIVDTLAASRRLIMVDEAHLATMDTLNSIRQLWDATRQRGGACPIVLAGLPALHRMLLRGRSDDSRGATLFSRIGVIRDLAERCSDEDGRGEPLFSVADIRRVFAQSKLRLDGAAERWLQGLACTPEAGSLRACDNAVRMAVHLLRNKPGKALTARMLQDVSRLLLGARGAKVVEDRIAHRAKVA